VVEIFLLIVLPGNNNDPEPDRAFRSAMNLPRWLVAVLLIISAHARWVQVATEPSQGPYPPYSSENNGNKQVRDGDGSM
jgi:hypothetical protein